MYRTAAVGVQCEQEGAEQTTLGFSAATFNPECLQHVCSSANQISNKPDSRDGIKYLVTIPTKAFCVWLTLRSDIRVMGGGEGPCVDVNAKQQSGEGQGSLLSLAAEELT